MRRPGCKHWLRAHWRLLTLVAAVAAFTALGRLDGTRVNAGDCRVFYDSAATVQR